MTQSKVYLDHNASAPLLAEAQEAMKRTMTMEGNPSSVHAHGRALSNTIEGARRSVAKAAGAKASEVVFTGSASEAITQGIIGGVRHFGLSRVIVSAGEHAAVTSAARISGVPVQTIGLLPNGEIDLEALGAALGETAENGERALVALHWVNNETGVIQPIAEIEKIVGPTPHILFVDAVQGFAKLPMDFSSSSCDMMAITAHKIGGPAGVGALLMKSHCDSVRLIPGGGQEHGRRSGTENPAGIVGLARALELAVQGLPEASKRMRRLRDRLEQGLSERIPGLAVTAEQAPRTPNTLHLSLPDVESDALLTLLDAEGIAVSAGSACSTGSLEPSHVLLAHGLPPERLHGALRLSLSRDTVDAEIERVLELMPAMVERLRALDPGASR